MIANFSEEISHKCHYQSSDTRFMVAFLVDLYSRNKNTSGIVYVFSDSRADQSDHLSFRTNFKKIKESFCVAAHKKLNVLEIKLGQKKQIEK